MKKRAQAALEFLMTYGWAILIMLVVIALLFFLGVFSPQSTVSKSCILPAGFTCYEFDMDSSGNIYLDLGQATGRTITITGIGCAPSSPNATLNPNVQIPTGSHAIITVGGTNCSGATNSNFKGKLLIQYTTSGSSGTRSVTGDVSAPLLGNSSSWGGGSYSGGTFLYRRQVTVNTGVASDLADFPAYFVINTNSLISAGKMNNTCKDLRVSDSSMSTLLDYEIEANTCNTSSTVVWFRIPQTLGTNNYVAYAYYGNNSTSDAQNTPGVWRNGFVAVYHLGNLTDSKAGNNAINSGATFTAGRIGNGTRFDGVASYLWIMGTGPNDLTANVTVTIWINALYKGADYGPNNWAISKDGAYREPYIMGAYGADTFLLAASKNGSAWDYWLQTAMTPSAWYHFAFVNSESAGGLLYKNGVLNTSNPAYTQLKSAPSATSTFGGRSGGAILNGTLDEIRMSNVARSADWIRAEYGQTYSVGGEQVN